MVSFAGQVLPPSPVLAPRDDAAQRLAGKASTSQRAPERREVAAEAEEDEDAAPRNDSEAVTSAKLLLAGGVAGAVSKSATAPLARLTILYQVRRQVPRRRRMGPGARACGICWAAGAALRVDPHALSRRVCFSLFCARPRSLSHPRRVLRKCRCMPGSQSRCCAVGGEGWLANADGCRKGRRGSCHKRQASLRACCGAESWPGTARRCTEHSSESRQQSAEPGKVLACTSPAGRAGARPGAAVGGTGDAPRAHGPGRRLHAGVTPRATRSGV